MVVGGLAWRVDIQGVPPIALCFIGGRYGAAGMMAGMYYEGPDDADADLFEDGSEVIDCPRCGAEIYAYAEKCPKCGVWLQMADRQIKGERQSPWRRWRTAGVVLMVALLLLWALMLI